MGALTTTSYLSPFGDKRTPPSHTEDWYIKAVDIVKSNLGPNYKNHNVNLSTVVVNIVGILRKGCC